MKTEPWAVLSQEELKDVWYVCTILTLGLKKRTIHLRVFIIATFINVAIAAMAEGLRRTRSITPQDAVVKSMISALA